MILLKAVYHPGGLAHNLNPSTQEDESGGSLWVPSQPELHSKTCLKITVSVTVTITVAVTVTTAAMFL